MSQRDAGQEISPALPNARFCTTVPCRTLQHAAAGCSSPRYPAHTSLTKHSSGAVYPQACSKARKSGVSPGLVENGLPLDGPRAALWWAEMAAGQVVLRRLSPQQASQHRQAVAEIRSDQAGCRQASSPQASRCYYLRPDFALLALLYMAVRSLVYHYMRAQSYARAMASAQAFFSGA